MLTPAARTEAAESVPPGSGALLLTGKHARNGGRASPQLGTAGRGPVPLAGFLAEPFTLAAGPYSVTSGVRLARPAALNRTRCREVVSELAATEAPAG